MLSFYGKIFIAQEETRLDINLEPIHIPAEVLKVKTSEKLPLEQISSLHLDFKAQEMGLEGGMQLELSL